MKEEKIRSYRKFIVIAVASILWLIVLVERLPESLTRRDEIGVDAAWVVGLADAWHRDYLAGRDFYFAYGPLAQWITWAGARLHAGWSPIDSLPLILLSFGCTSILLMGFILAFIRDLDAPGCAFVYAAVA